MTNASSTTRLFALGRWVLVAHAAVACEIVLFSLLLIAYTGITGHDLQLAEPYDTFLFVVMTVPCITVALLNGLLSLFVFRLIRKVHHAGTWRQFATFFVIFVPFWGMRRYTRFKNDTLAALRTGQFDPPCRRPQDDTRS